MQSLNEKTVSRLRDVFASKCDEQAENQMASRSKAFQID